MVVMCHDLIDIMEQQRSEVIGCRSHFFNATKSCYETVLFRSEQLLKVLEHLNGSFGQLDSSNKLRELISNIYDSKEVL